MKIESLGRNKTLVQFDQGNIAILISYSTPVAALIQESEIWKAYKTNQFHSVTTSRHIREWLKQWFDIAEEKDQSWFDDLLP